MTSGTHPRPPLDPARLPAGVEVLPEAASTNAILAERARAGADEAVLVTEHQTAGRGRLDRAWHTPARTALTFSVLRRPDLPPARWPWLPLLTGYAVHAALADRVPAVGLKWPNDVLVGDRKVAGILLERVETPTGPAAVIGIGLNVDLDRAELPVPTATSLSLELGAPPDRTALLADLLGSLDRAWPLLEQPDRLRSSYSGACVTIGQEVRVHLPSGEEFVGTAEAVDEHGQLVVRTPAGKRAVAAGDVVHVRPANL